jgi:hypothetical protein
MLRNTFLKYDWQMNRDACCTIRRHDDRNLTTLSSMVMDLDHMFLCSLPEQYRPEGVAHAAHAPFPH